MTEQVVTQQPEEISTSDVTHIDHVKVRLVPDEIQPATPQSEKKCPVDLKPMADWVGENDPKVCRPCMLAPVVQWYAEELRAAGKTGLALKLEEQANTEEPLTLCRELDTIKEQAEEPLRERLLDFDCAAQTFKEDEDDKSLRGGQTNGQD